MSGGDGCTCVRAYEDAFIEWFDSPARARDIRAHAEKARGER